MKNPSLIWFEGLDWLPLVPLNFGSFDIKIGYMKEVDCSPWFEPEKHIRGNSQL